MLSSLQRAELVALLLQPAAPAGGESPLASLSRDRRVPVRQADSQWAKWRSGESGYQPADRPAFKCHSSLSQGDIKRRQTHSDTSNRNVPCPTSDHYNDCNKQRWVVKRCACLRCSRCSMYAAPGFLAREWGVGIAMKTPAKLKRVPRLV